MPATDHCQHCPGQEHEQCLCRQGCARPENAFCTPAPPAPEAAELDPGIKAFLMSHLKEEMDDSKDPTDRLPMKCLTCQKVFANRAEARIHTWQTHHTAFRSTAAAIREVEMAKGADPLEPRPVICTECGFKCANRQESWDHLEESGHGSFIGVGRRGADDTLHCGHCRGRKGACSCNHGCPRPSTAVCVAGEDEDELLQLAIRLSLVGEESPAPPSAVDEPEKSVLPDAGALATPTQPVVDVGGAMGVAPADTSHSLALGEQPADDVSQAPAAHAVPPPAVDTVLPPDPVPAALAPRPPAPAPVELQSAVDFHARRLTDVEVTFNEDFAPIIGVMKVIRMKLNEAALLTMVEDIEVYAYIAAETGARLAVDDPHQLDEDQIGALYLYTMECGLYASMNELLRLRERQRLKPYFPLLRLMLEAKAKLPLCPAGTAVWRGVKADLRGKFTKGKTFYWWAFTSTTLKMSVLENPQFVGKEGIRTIFRIETITGRDITRYSFQQSAEAEVLLFPGAKFEVTDTAEVGDDLQMVSLKELVTPELVR